MTAVADGSARTELRACAAAFTFLTRLPVSVIVGHGLTDLGRAATYFPLVGLAVGITGAMTFAGAALLWPTAIAVILSIAATVWLTGAFHEDALADALDGFGGGWEKSQVLAIMKDSRVGSYALVGVVLVLATKIAALQAIAGVKPDALAVGRALVAGHVLGRWSSVLLIRMHPYVRPESAGERPSAGRPFVGGVTRMQVIVACALAILIVSLALGLKAIGASALALGITWLAGRYFQRRIGGITGDTLGAANQIVEVCVYLLLAG